MELGWTSSNSYSLKRTIANRLLKDYCKAWATTSHIPLKFVTSAACQILKIKIQSVSRIVSRTQERSNLVSSTQMNSHLNDQHQPVEHRTSSQLPQTEIASDIGQSTTTTSQQQTNSCHETSSPDTTNGSEHQGQNNVGQASQGFKIYFMNEDGKELKAIQTLEDVRDATKLNKMLHQVYGTDEVLMKVAASGSEVGLDHAVIGPHLSLLDVVSATYEKDLKKDLYLIVSRKDGKAI